jgi:hypothetical protein
VAFIIKASGLDKHGVHSKQPLVRNCPRLWPISCAFELNSLASILFVPMPMPPQRQQQQQAFSQLDIAGGAVENMDMRFGNPTATPLVALTARYVLQ